MRTRGAGVAELVVQVGYYSPPECKRSAHGPPRADAAADVWALGVLGLELLAHVRERPRRSAAVADGQRLCWTADAVEAQQERPHPPSAPPGTSAGSHGSSEELDLPWEGASADVARMHERLGPLKALVLACVSRDPAARPSATHFLHELQRTSGLAAHD
jgi:serine/threonine protein kinase